MEYVTMTVRIPEKQHRELRKKLIDDGLTFQDFAIRAIDQYLAAKRLRDREGKLDASEGRRN